MEDKKAKGGKKSAKGDSKTEEQMEAERLAAAALEVSGGKLNDPHSPTPSLARS